MAKAKTTELSGRKMRPALTPEGRESVNIALAMDLAEQQLRDGTASSQVIAHFLKLGSSRAELERAKLEHENQLLKAKTDAIQSAQREEELFTKAIEAMQVYSGAGGSSND